MHHSLADVPKLNEQYFVDVPSVLLPNHFKAYSKVKIHNHLYNCQDLPMRFEFKEYCPLVFRELRERFSVPADEYLVRACARCAVKALVDRLRAQTSMNKDVMRELSSSGRSGSALYTTHDARFVVKLLTKVEIAMLHQFLPQYYKVGRRGSATAACRRG